MHSPSSLPVFAISAASLRRPFSHQPDPVYLYYGELWSVGKPLVDDATGLPVVIVGGCTVIPPFVAEVEAYNATIRAWHAQLMPAATAK